MAGTTENAHLFSVLGDGHWPFGMECTANRVFEWLDILIFGVFAIEVVCMIANQVSREFQRLCSRSDRCMLTPALNRSSPTAAAGLFVGVGHI
jgi:hypothetical protein